jgi:hypothetical protein
VTPADAAAGPELRPPAAFEPRGRRPPPAGTGLRAFSVRHARGMERLYDGFERMLKRWAPAAARIGWTRLERPVAAVESTVKGALFDCRMCGQCILSSTGMSCPMNCPKSIRNGPCGGVRPDGGCEIYPEMRCVWVAAWDGARRMEDGGRIAAVQPPVDHRLKGRSSWLAVARGEHGRSQP